LLLNRNYSRDNKKEMKYFKDIIFFTKEYYYLLGGKIYVYLLSTVIPAFLDGVGISMIVPLLSLVISDKPYVATGNNSDFAYRILQAMGVEIKLNNILLFILGIYTFKFLISYGNSIFRSYLISLVERETRFQLYAQIVDLKYTIMQKRNTGYYSNLSSVELTSYISGFPYLAIFFTSVFTALSYLLFSFYIDTKFAILATVSGAFFALLFLGINKKVKQLSMKTTENQSAITSHFIEAIQSYKYLKATNGLHLFLNKLAIQIEQIRKQSFQSEKIRGFFMAVNEPLIMLMICFFIFLQVSVMGNSLVSMLLSIFLFHRALGNLMLTQKDWQFLMKCSGGIFRVAEQLKYTRQNKEHSGKTIIQNPIQSVEFRNVSFNYGNHLALDSIQLTIEGNTSVAFVGESGAGKTTLADITTLLYRPTSGEVYINNIPSFDIALDSYRKQIGLVSQDVYLYDDTIANNISLWDEYNEEKLMEACRKAHATHFINQLPEGFHTKIGDRGFRLSGGQKQRLSLARELYKKPSLLILDEATSALDSESESFIKETLDDLKGNVTIVMIAHRLSTIKEADKIIVLNNGKIEDTGTFTELTERSAYFKKIVQFQKL
jgi:ABC-type multidrug transport system fused ATPase/permease subunit